MRLSIVTLTILLASIATAQVSVTRIKRQLETSKPQEIQLDLCRGETVDLDLQFLSYGTAMDITGATITLHATTNGMPAGTSYQVFGSAGSNGTASVRIAVDDWLPYPLSSGTWTLECSQANASRIMRAKGALKVTGLYYPSTNSPIPYMWATNFWTSINGMITGKLDIASTASWTVTPHDAWITLDQVPPQTNQVSVLRLQGLANEWVSIVSGTATLIRVYNSGFILQGYGSPDYFGLGPSAPPDTYIFQTPARLEDGGITEVYDIPMASGYIYPFSLAISTAGIYSQIVIGSPQLSPSLWRTFETNYPVLIPPFPDEPGVEGGWVLSKITSDAPLTNSYPLALVSDIPAPILQTNQLYVSTAGHATTAGTLTGEQSNTVSRAVTNITVSGHGSVTRSGATVALVISNQLTGASIAAAGGLTNETDSIALGRLTTHTNRTDNPHSVTALQVGAYAANNPSNFTTIASVRTMTHTNQTWGASGTNATYQLSWDTSNKTFRVLEILP